MSHPAIRNAGEDRTGHARLGDGCDRTGAVATKRPIRVAEVDALPGQPGALRNGVLCPEHGRRVKATAACLHAMPATAWSWWGCGALRPQAMKEQSHEPANPQSGQSVPAHPARPRRSSQSRARYAAVATERPAGVRPTAQSRQPESFQPAFAFHALIHALAVTVHSSSHADSIRMGTQGMEAKDC
jgi:hypothetical protein